MKASYYHDLTSYSRHKMSSHSLDWANQPSVFKKYQEGKKIILPEITDLGRIQKNLFELFKHRAAPDRSVNLRTISELSELLLLTQALTARAQTGGKDYYFRSAASAGALYPTEIYAGTFGIEGLDDGLYHYSVSARELTLIREGPLLGDMPSVVLFFTVIFFRSSWKYRDRAYRYHLLDTGHVIENALAALKAMNIPCKLSYDFDDRALNLLLGLDETKEATLALLEIPERGISWAYEGKDPPALPHTFQDASRTAPREMDYGLIKEFHKACYHVNTAPQKIQVKDHLGVKYAGPALPIVARTIHGSDYPEALFRRRSRRNFKDRPLEINKLNTLLSLMSHDGSLLSVGALIRATGELSEGFFLINEKAEALLPVSRFPTIERMADICLHQLWLSRASAHILFLAAPSLLDTFFGARGYRYAMMEAGRLGQRLYLEAASLGIGCCGIGAFYDDEAAALLGLSGEARLLYLVALGETMK
jgi:SagB-type dehydrogenase family enzyme